MSPVKCAIHCHTERFYCVTPYLTEKLSKPRSFDSQQRRPQNCPFQSSFTHRTTRFTQGIPQIFSSVFRAVFSQVKLHGLTSVWGPLGTTRGSKHAATWDRTYDRSSICDVCGYHGSVAEDSSLLDCNAAATGKTHIGISKKRQTFTQRVRRSTGRNGQRIYWQKRSEDLLVETVRGSTGRNCQRIYWQKRSDDLLVETVRGSTGRKGQRIYWQKRSEGLLIEMVRGSTGRNGQRIYWQKRSESLNPNLRLILRRQYPSSVY